MSKEKSSAIHSILWLTPPIVLPGSTLSNFINLEMWGGLTIYIERVNKELKRRVKSMETLGERTLEILIAFTSIRLEFNWQNKAIDKINVENLLNGRKEFQTNQVELVVDSLVH